MENKDLAELKRLAEAAQDDPNSPYIPCQVAFSSAATPAAVLALIAENASLRGSCKAMGSGQVKRTIKRNGVLEEMLDGAKIMHEMRGKEIEELKAINFDYEVGKQAAEDEIARLQRAEKNDLIAYKAVIQRQNELREERDQIMAEVEALRKDAVRLDRLDQEREAYGTSFHEGNRWVVDGQFATVREGIDAMIWEAKP